MTDKPIIRADFVKPMPVPSRKVLQLVFEVPEEQADHAMAVLGGYPQSGENRWCAVALLAPVAGAEPTPEPATPATEQPERPKTEADKKLIKQAGFLPTKHEFQQWLYQDRFYRDLWDRYVDIVSMDRQQIAEQVIRDYCEVESRSGIRFGENSGQRMEEMIYAFRNSMEGRTDPDLERQARGEG